MKVDEALRTVAVMKLHIHRIPLLPPRFIFVFLFCFLILYTHACVYTCIFDFAVFLVPFTRANDAAVLRCQRFDAEFGVPTVQQTVTNSSCVCVYI